MGVLCFVYLLIALRTNLVFVLIFLLLVPSFGCLCGYYWNAAKGIMKPELLVTAGALTFVIDILGWYLVIAILLAAVDFPFSLPGKLHSRRCLTPI